MSDDSLVGFQNEILRFERLLGKGGMGAVYKGVQLSMNREVAIKVIASHRVENRKAIDRFLSEARTLGKLVHPHVISCHDVGEFIGPNGANVIFMLLEYVDGQSLGTMLKDAQLPIRDVLEYHRQAAEGLAAAHKLGIIHRDIKPDNIIVTSKGVAKLADFGLAKTEDDLGLTQDGAVIGTPYYIAPEIWRAKDADESSDIYSFGCSLFHMLTGAVPFKAKGALEIMQLHLNAPVPSLATHQPELTFLQPIINHCMAKNPLYRYQSAEKLALHLSQAVAKADPGVHSGKRQAIEPRLGKSSWTGSSANRPSERRGISDRRAISERRRAASKSNEVFTRIWIAAAVVISVVILAVVINGSNGKAPPRKSNAAGITPLAQSSPAYASPAKKSPEKTAAAPIVEPENSQPEETAVSGSASEPVAHQPQQEMPPPIVPVADLIADSEKPANPSDQTPAKDEAAASLAPVQPALVSLTAPADGETFPARATITLTAEVRDKVSKVEFFQGTRLLRTDTLSPYSYTWIKSPPGSYTLTARATDFSGARTTSAPVKITVAEGGSGNGLTGRYFPNLNLTDSKLTRLDPTIDFEWDLDAPDESLPRDFSARWTGYLLPQYSQSYTFYVTCDDGARLWVDGMLLVDEWFTQPPTEYSGSMNLQAGVKYPIKLDFFDEKGGATAQLRWSSDDTPKEIIPTARLFPDNAGVAATSTIPKKGPAAARAEPDSPSILLVDFGKDSEHNAFGLNGWSTVIKDKYTDYQDLGPGGTCIVEGTNANYDFQGITGTKRNFLAGEAIRVTWYNNSAAEITFTPMISFTINDRFYNKNDNVEKKVYPMTTSTIPARGSGTSEFEFTPASAGAYWIVNVNVHFEQKMVLVADKIELIPIAPSPGKGKVSAKNNGLVGYWNFDERKGTIARDGSGAGNDATLMREATWGEGRIKGGVAMDANGHVELNSVAGLPQGGTGNPFSVCCWFFCIEGNDGEQRLVARWDDRGNQTDWILRTKPGKNVQLLVRTSENGGGVCLMAGIGTGPTGSWHHLVGVYLGGTEAKVYLDGVCASDVSQFKENSRESSPHVTIGGGQEGESRNCLLSGKVDEVRIYNRALSDQEVAELFRLTVAQSVAAPKDKKSQNAPGKSAKPIMLVDFGKSSSLDAFGLTGWSTVIKDMYTDNRDVGPGGTTQVVGVNRSYDFQGLTGVPRTFHRGESIRATWYNNSATEVSLTPQISFITNGRLNDSEGDPRPGTYSMASATIPPFSSATSDYVFTAASEGEYSLVNVNVHSRQNNVIVVDKIELIPVNASP